MSSMGRFVAALIVALASAGGRAVAADSALASAAKKQVDESLIVFSGEVLRLGQDPMATGSVRQSVVYKVNRVLRGAASDSELTVEHAVFAHPDPSGKTHGLDPKLFAEHSKLIVGAQLRPTGQGQYVLYNTSRVFGPVAWSRQLEDDVAQYASSAPAVQPEPRESPPWGKCIDNLSRLVNVLLMNTMTRPAAGQKWSGPSIWLDMRKTGADVKRGDESILICPCDKSAHVPSTEAEKRAYDDVDLNRPASGLCSYVGRDCSAYPIPAATELASGFGGPVVVGACLHHPGGVVIANLRGGVEFLTLEELGLSSEAEKIVGPTSKSPLLRGLR
jgi:hypothetical protein